MNKLLGATALSGLLIAMPATMAMAQDAGLPAADVSADVSAQSVFEQFPGGGPELVAEILSQLEASEAPGDVASGMMQQLLQLAQSTESEGGPQLAVTTADGEVLSPGQVMDVLQQSLAAAMSVFVEAQGAGSDAGAEVVQAAESFTQELVALGTTPGLSEGFAESLDRALLSESTAEQQQAVRDALTAAEDDGQSADEVASVLLEAFTDEEGTVDAGALSDAFADVLASGGAEVAGIAENLVPLLSSVSEASPLAGEALGEGIGLGANRLLRSADSEGVNELVAALTAADAAPNLQAALSTIQVPATAAITGQQSEPAGVADNAAPGGPEPVPGGPEPDVDTANLGGTDEGPAAGITGTGDTTGGTGALTSIEQSSTPNSAVVPETPSGGNNTAGNNANAGAGNNGSVSPTS